jgi:hypothetical protein
MGQRQTTLRVSEEVYQLFPEATLGIVIFRNGCLSVRSFLRPKNENRVSLGHAQTTHGYVRTSR